MRKFRNIIFLQILYSKLLKTSNNMTLKNCCDNLADLELHSKKKLC